MLRRHNISHFVVLLSKHALLLVEHALMLNLLLDLLLHLLLSTGLVARVTCSSRRTITLTGDGRNPSLQRLNTILIKPSHSIDLRVLLVVELPLILQEAPIVVVA